MTPTIALKCRLDRGVMQDAVSRHWNVAREIRRNLKNADGGPPLLSTTTLPPAHRARQQHAENEDDAAKLLLSMSNIVTNEIKNNSHAFDDEGDFCSSTPEEEDESSSSSFHQQANSEENLLLTPRGSSQSPTLLCDAERFQWNRVRTVSIDSPLHTSRLSPRVSEPLESFALERPALISPMSTPIGRGRPVRRASLKLAQKSKREHLKMPRLPQITPVTVGVKEYKKKALQNCLAKGCKIQTIGRKKFSWKNYPELESFLIANRDEYLRHSALNYTVQQKQYNNRLTEQLLELAAEHGYVFDEIEFNFVTVRDRIRCYFKSYVQSAKKRGITVGYAARKAGLLSEDDLRVDEEGEIIVPSDNNN